jgi:hypothetical protein
MEMAMASNNDFVPDPYPLTPEEYAAARAKARGKVFPLLISSCRD